MMTTVEIVTAEFCHIDELSGNLRHGDWSEITAMGDRPWRMIRRCLKRSLWSRTALVRGNVAAMWGVAGMLGGTGEPWLLTSQYVEERPVTFIKQAKIEVASMLDCFFELKGFVAADYAGAVRLLSALGFELSPVFIHNSARFQLYSKRRTN